VSEPDFSNVVQIGFETTKQLTTLSAGSIVVIGTFLSNIFPTDKHGILAVPGSIKLLIAAAFVGFGATLISATFMMFRYSTISAETIATGRPIIGLLRLLPFIPFAGATICFGAAVLLNMFR
jgi:hypothetical protein